MKILIVDDIQANLHLLRMLLEGHKHEIVAATNGVEALEKARREPPDMVISDIMMPVMDGYSLCCEWKEDNHLKYIPFVFYTAAYTDPRDEELALNMGADRFIAKPVAPSDFIKIIQNVMTDADEGKIVPKKPSLKEEKEIFKLYNKRLVDKLEDKTLQLGKEVEKRRQTEKTLKKNEEKLRSILDSMNDDVYICSPECRIEFMNQKMFDRIGRDATGEPCHKAIYDADQRCPWCPIDKVLQGEHIEYEMVHPGNGRYYILTNSPLNNPDGHISKLTIARDVTEKKEMQARLLQAQKMEAIGTLAGGIAHDFNNILYAMIGFVELAMEDIESGSLTHDNLKAGLAGALRAKQMVKQILAFSSKTSGEKSPIRIQTVVKEALYLLRTSIPATIEIRQNIDAACSPVLADPTQIHQVVMNLSTNAYYAMREKGGVLEWALAEEKIDSAGKALGLDPGPYLKLSVSDTGHGIDDKILEKIFDPYFSTKGPGEGTGMGLAVVHGIVQEHGGVIKMSSELGRGTTFHIYLPRIKTGNLEQQKESAAPAPTGTEHVLFVDDKEQIIYMGRQVLKRLGYRVTTRTSSVEALEAFKANPNEYDLVITDMTMPNMTGADLALKLKEIRPDIPLILCTGFSDTINEAKARKMGFGAYIMKPILKTDLAVAIRAALDGKR